MAMETSTRRAMLLMLLGAGTAGSLAARLHPLAARLPAELEPLPMPDGPMRLERVLQRGQGESASITVRRSWEVRFARQARGMMVSGRQLAAEVSAPPHLAELARIERERDASTLFPLALSERGAILPADGAPAASDAVSAALRAAEAMIARQPVPADTRERYRLYLAQVHRAGSGLLDTLPTDLFFPSGIAVERSEALALPEGLNGSFALHYLGEPQPGAPWLKRAERRVVTRVGGLERSASEVWTLAVLA
jgi:hypothetical protein